MNQIGPILLDHFKNHVDGLYMYFMKDKIKQVSVGKHWLRKLTNISVVIIISYGVIGWTGAWRITTSFAFWKIMLGTPVRQKFLLNRGYFVTKISTQSSLFQSGIQQEKCWSWISKLEYNVDYFGCVKGTFWVSSSLF